VKFNPASEIMWIRFTLRDAIWLGVLTVIACLALVDHYTVAKQRDRFEQDVRTFRQELDHLAEVNEKLNSQRVPRSDVSHGNNAKSNDVNAAR
jgi:tRNA isopentenyl-2-thiomethyl-A-37 hydroxylase MiaE